MGKKEQTLSAKTRVLRNRCSDGCRNDWDSARTIPIDLSSAEQRVRTLLDHAPDAIVMLDVETGRFIDANLMAEQLFGVPRGKLLEVGPFELSPPRQPGGSSCDLARERIAEALEGGAITFEWWHCNARGERFPCDVHLVRMPWENRVVIRGSIMESSGRKLLELSEVSHSKILQMIARGATLTETLEQLVRTVENLLPGLICSVLLLDQESDRLRLGAAPGLPSFYNAAVDGLQIGPTVGCCGAAAFTGQRVVAADVTTHPNWTAYRELAERAGIRACWSEPILSLAGTVLGTFAMYYHEPIEPAPVELRVIQTAAQTVSVAIERVRAHNLLRELNETLRRRVALETKYLVEANEKLRLTEQELRLAAVAFDVHDSIVITDVNGTILRVNQAFTKLTGYTADEVVGTTPRVLRSGRHDDEFYHEMWRTIATKGFWEGEIWNRRKDGQEYLQRLTIACVRDSLGRITHYVANGQDLTHQKRAEADRAEILAASSVQRAFLPPHNPCVPGLDIAGSVYPADCVSGDFFNFFTMGQNQVGILIADVSGHGLGAGLVMAKMQAHLRSLTEGCDDPHQLLTDANRGLSWSDSGHFVTMFLGRLDPQTRSFIYAGAGHQGYLVKASGAAHILQSTGAPLGIEATWDADPDLGTVLEAGDLIVLPTDGIEEARNPDRVQFGRNRMLDVIRDNASKPAAEIIECLYHATRRFSAGESQHDDIAAIVVKVLPENGEPSDPSHRG